MQSTTNEILSFKNRIFFTGILTLLIGSWLAWDYYHGGVPVHHLLHRGDLPGFSNWWGALLLPVLSWFLLYRIQKRDKLQEKERNNKSTAFYGFIGALFTGIFFSILFSYGFENVLGYFMLVLLSIGLFLPTYRSEYLLGFILGITYVFGSVLPTIIGSVLALAGLLMHEVIRPVGLFLGSKISNFYKRASR
jgi:fructose-specific phosphotransferase system IIC component